ncbi:MAG TPA: hypothetical protein DD473_09095 [Planctomycetaceae bacterium]|nr:hypothetical protein [Planctomycetaceae bacterium]
MSNLNLRKLIASFFRGRNRSNKFFAYSHPLQGTWKLRSVSNKTKTYTEEELDRNNNEIYLDISGSRFRQLINGDWRHKGQIFLSDNESPRRMKWIYDSPFGSDDMTELIYKIEDGFLSLIAERNSSDDSKLFEPGNNTNLLVYRKVMKVDR